MNVVRHATRRALQMGSVKWLTEEEKFLYFVSARKSVE
jgi:hypothetical protein